MKSVWQPRSSFSISSSLQYGSDHRPLKSVGVFPVILSGFGSGYTGSTEQSLKVTERLPWTSTRTILAQIIVLCWLKPFFVRFLCSFRHYTLILYFASLGGNTGKKWKTGIWLFKQRSTIRTEYLFRLKAYFHCGKKYSAVQKLWVHMVEEIH